MRLQLNRHMAEQMTIVVSCGHSMTTVGTPVTASDKINDAIKQASQRMSFYPMKPKQLEAIRAFMSGNDTFVSLPTGYGKSAIYAVLPLAFDILFGM